ncbi:MAG: ABC transporter substrate-binding protein, partial [Caldilineaceae bacterium]
MYRRRYAVLSVIFVLALLLGACAMPAQPAAPAAGEEAAVDTSADAGAEAAADEPIELRIAWWGSQDRHDRTIKVIEMFEELHPNISIVYEFSGWDDHWTKMATQAAGGNLPDIMQQDYARLEEWVDRDLLTPLDAFVDDGTIDFTNVTESEVAGGRIDGELYGLNLGNNSMAILLDLDAFEKAGVDLPEPDWTWADFEETATQLHDALDIWGMGDGLSNEQMWKNLYLSNGEWSYNDDGTGLGYEDDTIFQNYLEMIMRLQEAGVIPTREWEIGQAGVSVEAKPIVTGESAMDMFWSNQIVAVQTAAGEERNFRMHPMPRLEGGVSANYIKPSMFWSITSQANHPKEAAMFLDYFTNDIDANMVLFAERGVPISSAVRDALKPELGK